MNCIKGKITFNVVMLVITMIFILYSSMFLLNCMISYKYHIDQNFDHATMYITYSARKTELLMMMRYLKISISYFIFLFIYFIYRIRK